jgi:ABC-type enterochelin transport system permease subunit
MVLLRDIIPGGLYSAIFFASRQHLENYNGLANPVIAKFMLGGMMGAIYWFLAYPFDLVRNIQQSTEPKTQATISNAFKAILKTYGLKGLYRGAGVTVARSLVTCGISLSLFDTFLKMLDVDFN